MGPDIEGSALAAVEIKILASLVVALFLLLAGGGYTYRTSARYADAVEWVTHTQEVRTSVASLYGSLEGAEVAMRDYVLTMDPERRADYDRSITEASKQLADLKSLTLDNAVQQQHLAALEPMVAVQLEGMTRTLRAYADFGLPAARAVMGLRRRTNAAQEVRSLTDRMASVENGLLAARRAQTTKERQTTLISLLVTFTAAMALFTVLFRAIHRGMRARRDSDHALRASMTDVQRSESDLREANRFLDSLVENLPVVIAVKDANTLTFVRQNRAFERAFGYSRDELIGKSPRDVFTAEEADFIIASDREALEQNRLVDIPEHLVHTRHLGPRIFHTMKMPIGDRDGSPQFLLAIWTDVTERKLAERAIRELNTALEAKAAQLTAINKELESFSYSVSHDLRAPLRAIDGFALMIEEDCDDRLDAEGRRYLSVIRDNSRRMGELIDDLLAFSRLGRLPLVTHEINVESLVREVVEEAFDGQATTPRIEIGKLPSAQGDRVLLRQVWANLISNAVKYSSKSLQPRIEVSGQRSANENLYSIRDNGVGFNMDYVDKLFGVFQRLHRAGEFSGTGVGLAIVHRIVSRHGGRVWAEGKENEGAVFSFALPKRVDNG